METLPLNAKSASDVVNSFAGNPPRDSFWTCPNKIRLTTKGAAFRSTLHILSAHEKIFFVSEWRFWMVWIYGYGSKPLVPKCEHQNSWDLWMWITTQIWYHRFWPMAIHLQVLLGIQKHYLIAFDNVKYSLQTANFGAKQLPNPCYGQRLDGLWGQHLLVWQRAWRLHPIVPGLATRGTSSSSQQCGMREAQSVKPRSEQLPRYIK